MQAPMMKFLGWDKPAVDLVADELLAGLQNQESALRFGAPPWWCLRQKAADACVSGSAAVCCR